MEISTCAHRFSSCAGTGEARLITEARTGVLNAVHAATPITARQRNMLIAPQKRYIRELVVLP
ncbi:MAG: hypothetical protein M0C28_44140 [Candidatus Moduliflexus flocculans]|nr:hypothetical protein [Candidatus Moduliflexus flocculans]